MGKPIVVVAGTLDTKSAEYAFLKRCLIDQGVAPFVIDVGVLGEPGFAPDIPAETVATEGGRDLATIRFGVEGSDTRAVALETMARGLARILARLVAERRCDAIVGLGGSGGTTVLSHAMRLLPLGVPKLIVSTLASGNVANFVGGRDITTMYSVTDIAGLNRFSSQILANAAHAAAGMASGADAARAHSLEHQRPLIALTMFGITTRAVLAIRERLEAQDFDVIVFHATGSGGRAMERMIDEGEIDGVIDCTLAELCSEAFGGIFSAGPERLTAAGRRGIPQVVVPGAIEVLNFGPRESLPAPLDVPERMLIVHNPHVCAVKATREELAQLGRTVAERLAPSTGPTAIVFPLRGLDAYEAPDGPWHDPATDAVLFAAVRERLRDGIQVTEVDANINDPVFADHVVDVFLRLWQEREPRTVEERA
jgi:uncharacterized protein (UPF0261 family)